MAWQPRAPAAVRIALKMFCAISACAKVLPTIARGTPS